MLQARPINFVIYVKAPKYLSEASHLILKLHISLTSFLFSTESCMPHKETSRLVKTFPARPIQKISCPAHKFLFHLGNYTLSRKFITTSPRDLETRLKHLLRIQNIFSNMVKEHRRITLYSTYYSDISS